MVTCQSSELGWKVTVELPADFLSLGRESISFLVSYIFLLTLFICANIMFILSMQCDTKSGFIYESFTLASKLN